MAAELKAVLHFDDVLLAKWVIFAQFLQNFDFFRTIGIVFLKHFEGYDLHGLVVEALEDLSESSLAELLLDLIPVVDMLTNFTLIHVHVGFRIIFVEYVGQIHCGFDVLTLLDREPIDNFMVADLTALIIVQQAAEALLSGIC